MKNIFFWGGEGGSVGRGGLINFLPLKRGGSLLEGGGVFERGGFIEDLRCLFSML